MRTKFIIGCSLLLLCGQIDFAAPVPAFNLTKLLNQTASIVIVQRSGGADEVAVKSTLIADGLKTGDHFKLTAPPELRHLLDGGHWVCIFLSSASAGQRHLSSDHYGWLVVDPKHLASSSGRDAIEDQALDNLESADAAIQASGIAWIQRLKSARGNAKLATLAKAPAKSRVIIAGYLETTIPAGNVDVLRRAVSFINDAEIPKENPELTNNVKWAFSHIQKTNAEGKLLLNQQMEGNDEALVKAIVLSAHDGSWPDKSSVAPLHAALGQLDPDGQFECLIVLASLTNRTPPNYHHFQTNRAAVLAEWQSWWNQSGRTLYSQPAPVTPKTQPR